jgi:hypothetical protein
MTVILSGVDLNTRGFAGLNLLLLRSVPSSLAAAAALQPAAVGALALALALLLLLLLRVGAAAGLRSEQIFGEGTASGALRWVAAVPVLLLTCLFASAASDPEELLSGGGWGPAPILLPPCLTGLQLF